MGALPLIKDRKDFSLEEYYQFQDKISTEGLVIAGEVINRVEFYNGEIWFMAGGTINHSRISGNLYYAIRSLLDGAKCEPFGSDTNLALDKFRNIFHPDLFIVCDGIKTSEFDKNGITNASVIIEVLSKGTEAYDRGGKFRKYKQISTFKEYILINQDKPLVESFVRHDSNLWSIHYFEGLESSFKIETLNLSVSLKDVYSGIEWETKVP